MTKGWITVHRFIKQSTGGFSPINWAISRAAIDTVDPLHYFVYIYIYIYTHIYILNSKANSRCIHIQDTYMPFE